MRAMVLASPGKPLQAANAPKPVAGPGQVLVRVRACGVCRTDLHVVDGELPEPKLPLIPGHQIVTLVPTTLRAVSKGGTVVCAGIHMSDIPSFSYDLLWGERSVLSVANLTREDGEEFLSLAPQVPVRTEVKSFPLERANEALESLRAGRIQGAAVLTLDDEASSVCSLRDRGVQK